MSTKKDCSLSDTTELRKLILKNPDLPLLFFCGEDSWNGEYSYTQSHATKGEIETLILHSDLWLTEEDYGEKLFEELSDEEEYKSLGSEALNKMIDEKVAAADFVKAIVIWIG